MKKDYNKNKKTSMYYKFGNLGRHHNTKCITEQKINKLNLDTCYKFGRIHTSENIEVKVKLKNHIQKN